jgi:hypothetical protein
MDIGHLTDLLPYSFSIAANFGHEFLHHVVESGQDVWAALHEHDSMPEAARNFQIFKITGSTIGLGICTMNASVEGITAFAIADGEALMELSKAGHQWRVTHANEAAKIPQPPIPNTPV